jgi:hypothetical protein
MFSDKIDQYRCENQTQYPVVEYALYCISVSSEDMDYNMADILTIV